MKRKIKLFGRSIPLGVLLAIAATAIAAAAFTALLHSEVSITVGNGPDLATILTCEVTAGAGSVTCSLDGNDAVIAGEGFDDDTILEVDYQITNTKESGYMGVLFTPPTSPAISAYDCYDQNSNPCAIFSLGRGDTKTITVVMEFGNLVKGMEVEGFSYDLEFD